jgi:hypothetical protein
MLYHDAELIVEVQLLDELAPAALSPHHQGVGIDHPWNHLLL